MTHRTARAALAALLSAAGACHGSEPTNLVGPPTKIEKTTEPAGSVLAGASAGVFAVKVSDAGGRAVVGSAVAFAVTGNATVSPASVPTDAAGVAQTTVTAGSAAGPITVEATVSGTGLKASASVSVTAVFAGCAAFGPPHPMTVGEIYQAASSACLGALPAGGEFTAIVYNGDTLGARSATLTGDGLGAAPATSLIAPSPALAYRGGSGVSTTLVPDLAVHERMMRQGRALTDRWAGARQWQASRRAATGPMSTHSASGSVPSYSAIGTAPVVGSVLSLNVNADSACSRPRMHGVRVMAVGTKAIVMMDTLNPANGFTDADYQDIAAGFDNLIYPLDVGNFGAPSDIDNNGRVGILFTRAVNELTPATNNDSYVGGFFYGRDLFPHVATAALQACAGSNEGEMFYMLAPDSAGTINGHVRSTAMVKALTPGTIAHEFQHLINASRRIYVNSAAGDEDIWLNEGLSHVAEELLYYRESGMQPRSNLTDAVIRAPGSLTYKFWKQDAAQNFQRFASYLSNPASNSPDASDDLLATRGGTWSFLRYAADRFYPMVDNDVWFRLVNSTTSGLGTLRLVFGPDQVGLFRDWTIANYVDDLGITTDPRYQHASWNFRDIFTKTFIRGVYPLSVTGLATGASVSVSVQRNSAAYYRFSTPTNGEALLRLSNAGSAPSGALQLMVVRTK